MTDKPDITALLEEHQNLIYKIVHSYCPDRQEQEDLIQEIMLQLVKGYDRFDHRVKVTTWMYKVAFNVAISHYRKTKRRRQYILSMPDKPVQISAPIKQEVDGRLLLLRKFIANLDPLHRAIMIMYLDENSHAEIAEAMGITVSNVGTKIGRVKKLLKQKFNQ
ncbi:MAG TPA: sigma-70 family RNA polymerase sigma factor [Saprospiraceae bacterium]|nr:sigma-70 family RNA polymerase sigma factor [Saprospiraceae bacterium]